MQYKQQSGTPHGPFIAGGSPLWYLQLELKTTKCARVCVQTWWCQPAVKQLVTKVWFCVCTCMCAQPGSAPDSSSIIKKPWKEGIRPCYSNGIYKYTPWMTQVTWTAIFTYDHTHPHTKASSQVHWMHKQCHPLKQGTLCICWVRPLLTLLTRAPWDTVSKSKEKLLS